MNIFCLKVDKVFGGAGAQGARGGRGSCPGICKEGGNGHSGRTVHSGAKGADFTLVTHLTILSEYMMKILILDDYSTDEFLHYHEKFNAVKEEA